MMDLSVVVASIDASRSIERCVQHLERSCAGIRAEIIVVDASRDDTPVRLEALRETAACVRCEPGTLAPQLWANGYRRATGRIVAFTTGQCLVSPGWARSLVSAIDAGASGAGGPLILADDSGVLDWAVFYLRYAGFMPHALGDGRTNGEIAGDNAAYARSALDRHASAFDQGFWEVDFHRLVRSDGGWLAAVPAASIAFSRAFPAATILAHRFAHGRHFGAGRVARGGRAAWLILLAAPLVPFVLAFRSGRHAIGGPRPWRFGLALPWFLVLAGAWAAGEATGAWTAKQP